MSKITPPCTNLCLTCMDVAAAPTAITVNGDQARAGAAYFVIKPDIVNGEFEINLVTQGYV